MPKAKEIYEYIDSLAPFCKQEEWDNSGFLIGDENTEVKSVLLALDCTNEVLEYAKKSGCELVITHHPIIFGALKQVKFGSEVYTAVNNGLSVICAHTSYDVAEGGVSDILATTLSAENTVKSPSGILTVGDVKKTTVGEYARIVGKTLSASVRACLTEKEVQRVAFCGGAGSDYLPEAKEMGCDLLVTGDAGHHDFLDAINLGIGLIAAGHFETEAISIKPLCDRLQEKFDNVKFTVFEQKTPITYI